MNPLRLFFRIFQFFNFSSKITYLVSHLSYLVQQTASLWTASFKEHLYVNFIYVEILHIRAKFQTAMVSCSRFIWVTNSSDHRRVWTANLLHTKYLLDPVGYEASYANQVIFFHAEVVKFCSMFDQSGSWKSWPESDKFYVT